MQGTRTILFCGFSWSCSVCSWCFDLARKKLSFHHFSDILRFPSVMLGEQSVNHMKQEWKTGWASPGEDRSHLIHCAHPCFPSPPCYPSPILSCSTLLSFEHSPHLDGRGFVQWDIPWKLAFAKVLCATAALPLSVMTQMSRPSDSVAWRA